MAEGMKTVLITGSGRGIGEETLIYLCSCPAPLQYIKGEFRHQVLVKLRRSRESGMLLELMGAFARSWEGNSLPVFEINPQNML